MYKNELLMMNKQVEEMNKDSEDVIKPLLKDF